MLWLQFIICALIIIISGSRLTTYADIISKKTGFSAGLMGILILAFVTSCPELVVSLSSVNIVNAPDLAAGDLLGANIFNILAIAVLGLLCVRGSSLLAKRSRSNVLIAVLTILMLLVIITFIILSRFCGLGLGLFNVSFGSIIVGGLYIGGMFIISRYESNTAKSNAGGAIGRLTIIKMAVSAVIIIITGVWLAYIGKGIADYYRLEEMYVGMLLIAFATTMPEFVVSYTALKRNSVHMATGNLLGSNLFNLFIIFILDIFFRKGEFFSYISGLNIFPAALAVILTIIALSAMLLKPSKKVFRYFSWDSILIIMTFCAGHYILFRLLFKGQ